MSYESHKYYNGNLYVSIVMDVKTRNLYAGIAYFKWPYENYNRKDVGIAKCSF